MEVGVAIVTPLKVTVTAVFGTKLTPVIVTDVETGPLFWDREMVGGFTVNCVWAVLTLSAALTM